MLGLAGCATATREPANLYPHKLELRAYVERGDYQREIVAVAAQAQAWIEQRASKGGARLTVIFDLDETLLLNWPHMSAMDFGYVPREWDRWVEEAKAPAIEPVREVYRAARQRGLEVVFITGRRDNERPGTERNLRAIDCADYAALIFKPMEDKRATGAFKTAMREKLVAEGRTIIANIGDQDSDLVGGFSERIFKLPNPFYITQ